MNHSFISTLVDSPGLQIYYLFQCTECRILFYSADLPKPDPYSEYLLYKEFIRNNNEWMRSGFYSDCNIYIINAVHNS